MEKTISKAFFFFVFGFSDIYTTLSEESKKLVFAFAQGMETQRLISQDKLVADSRTTASG